MMRVFRSASKRSFVIALLGLFVLVGTLNLPSGSKVRAQDNITILADSGFNPATDSFAFENYASPNKPYTNMTPVEVHRMFGDKVCEPGTESQPNCTLVPGAAQWMETTNSEMDGGHCGGMAILSELFYIKKADPSSFNADKTATINFSESIQREIAYWWGTNTLPVKTTQTIYGKPSEVVDALVKSINEKSETYSLEVWKDLSSGEGHAVTPIRVEDKGNGLINIVVYDNNYPLKSNIVEVDRNKETWQYNLSVNPSVEATVWSGDATSQTMYLAANSWRLDVQDPGFVLQPTNALSLNPYPFAAGPGTAQKYNSVTLSSADNAYTDILFTDEQGHKFGMVEGKSYNEIPGAFIDRLPNAGPVGVAIEPIYYIPVGTKFTITLDGSQLKKDTVNDLVMIGPGYDVSLDALKVKPGDKDTVDFSPDGTEISYTPTNTQEPNITVGVEHQGADYIFDILGSDIEKGSTLHIKLDYNAGQLRLDTLGNQKASSYDLIIDRYDNATTQTYHHSGVSLKPGATEYINFGKWDGKNDLTIGVDENSDGQIDKTDSESNLPK